MKRNVRVAITVVTVLISVLAVVAVIFYNSTKTGEESTGLSDRFVDFILKIFNRLGLYPDRNNLSFLVRKTAHFIEYFILSAVISYLIYFIFKQKSLIVFAPLICLAVALCDEFIIQGSTVGRTPMLSDVAIDLCGAVVAALIISTVLLIKQRKENEKT